MATIEVYDESMAKANGRESNDQKEVEEKMKFYDSQCHRFGLQKVKVIQNCLRESRESLDVQHYGIGSLQCQVIFETISMPPVTQLTSISLKDNQLESFCCHRIASFVKISATLEVLTLDGCKYVAGSNFRHDLFLNHDLLKV
jgi:hypothetical protein